MASKIYLSYYDTILVPHEEKKDFKNVENNFDIKVFPTSHQVKLRADPHLSVVRVVVPDGAG